MRSDNRNQQITEHKKQKVRMIVTPSGRRRAAQTKGTTDKPTTEGFCFVSNKVENLMTNK